MNSTDDNWKTAWLCGGQISELVWIGQDALAWCSGLHVVFLDVATHKLRLPRFPGEVVVAGATCLSGHLHHPIFAFAEKDRKPRIHVYAYPSLTRLSVCDRGTSQSYLATGFNGDFMVSLDSMPDFKLTVWSWRNGEVIASVKTEIHDAGDYGQTLRLNYSSPVFIAQLGNTSAQLSVWEMTTCGKLTILTENKIALPKKALAKDIAWCPDTPDLLAVCDRDGHVYLTDSTGGELRRVVLSQRCGFCAEIEPAAVCWYRGGIILRTTFCQIRYYRRDESDFWRKIWYKKTAYYPCALTSHPLKNDRLYFATREGHVVRIGSSEDASAADVTLNVEYLNGGRCRFVDFLHPWDEQIVVGCDKSSELSVVEARHGVRLAKVDLEIEGKVAFMVSHFDYPLVVVCTDAGEVVFSSFLRPDEPRILGKYRLHADVLDFMKLSSSGSHLAVCQKENGKCFVLNVSHSQPIDVVAELDAGLRIVDVVLFDAPNELKMFVLYQSSNIDTIGHKLVLFELPRGQAEFRRSSDVISMTSYFQSLHCLPSEINTFVGTPYLTKQLRFFKTNDWKEVINFDTVPNNHDLRQVKIVVSRKWFITCSIDGTIVVRNLAVKSSKNLRFSTHHRCDFGTRRAIFSSSGDSLLALGFDGSIVVMRHFRPEDAAPTDKKFKNFHEFGSLDVESYAATMDANARALDARVVEFLSTHVQSFGDDDESRDITWVEWKKQKLMDDERRAFAEEKSRIMENFTALKNKVVELLNKNEISSDHERLPIAKFALNKHYREKRTKAARDEREDVKHRLNFDSREREAVADWIQSNLWSSQKVLARSIFGMFNDTEVTNYTVSSEKPSLPGFYDYAQFAQSVMREFTHGETIYPWRYTSAEEINQLFDKQLRIKKPVVEEKIDLTDKDEENAVDEAEELNKRLFEGFTTHHFIEPSGSFNTQFKVYAYSQILFDNRIIFEDCQRLRLYFNRLFEDAYALKEREMTLARERIDRILFVASELELMFDEMVEESFGYPDWEPREKPESIIRVEDHEIAAKIYVSPSQQDIIDRQAAEEERQRLAMLADDFRERALQAMMDGVLEVRWEDLIKRDVPQPECLVNGKSRDDWTDEDAAAVKKYEQDSAKLATERQRYRTILRQEYAKISAALADGIDRFNSRLEEFHLLKMKVEASIQQLNLRYARQLVRHVHRIDAFRADDEARRRVAANHRAIARLAEEARAMQAAEEELRERQDGLAVKDRQMEKALRSEFAAMSKSAFAAVWAQYRRRPRAQLRASSARELLDLGRSIRSTERLPYLNAECLEYLRHLEALEVRPASLPPSVETAHWASLIALRRLKIEHELKQHALALDLDEVARSLANHARKQSRHRSNIDELGALLARLRDERLEQELDAELQLVLKMGQTEITLRGSAAADAANALLVPRVDIERVNEAVVAAGARKLRTMERSLEFRRGIKLQEWEHRCLRMRLEHRNVEMYYVTMANVTREMRQFLDRQAKGLKEDKNAHKMRKEFEATRIGQENLLKVWETRLERVAKEVPRLLQKNASLDRKIVAMNVDRCDMELQRDTEGEARQRRLKSKILELVTERSAVVRKLLANYEEMLELRKKLDAMACISGTPMRAAVDDLSVDEDCDVEPYGQW